MSQFGVKEVVDAVFYNVITGKPELFFNTLKVSTLENAAETVYASGGQGAPRLIGWDYGRTANIQLQDALLSETSLGMLAGQDAVEGTTDIHEREIADVSAVDSTAGTADITVANTVSSTTSDTFVFGGTAAELGTDYNVSAISGTTITVDDPNGDLAVGDSVTAYYKYASASTAKKVTISADKFPNYYKVTGSTLVRNNSGVDEPFQLVIPKAKLMPTFTMTMDAENVSTFDFNLEIFRDDNSEDMIQMIKY